MTIQEKRTISLVKKFELVNGQLLFTDSEYNIKFSDLFFVKVGAVSGDDAFFNEGPPDRGRSGLKDFVCSKTQTTHKTRKMYYFNDISEPNLPQWMVDHKAELLKRKVKNFTEENWWHWGRGHYHRPELARIYVNCKTRQKNPFFYHSCKDYDGSVLAIFPRKHMDAKEMKKVAEALNKVKWQDLGFMCNNRFIFSQKSLENTLLPDEFEIFQK